MTPGFAKTRAELPWLYYPRNDRVIINAHNFSAPASALLTNLVSYWKMDEASGNALDAHGSNTLAAGGTGSIASAAGIIGTSRLLASASSQRFEIADNASVSLGDIDCTFSFWVRFVMLPGTGVDLISKDLESGSNREYILGWSGTRLRFGVFNSGGSFTQVVANTFGALSINTWYHVIAYHDSVNNVLGIVVNGTSDTVSYTTGIRDAAAPFAIGRRPSGFNYLDGRIDEVGFWKRMLTSGERASLYNSGSGLGYPF